jgi:hypothetical protein
MNKMNMPGFTAGASLYPAVGKNRTFSISNVPSDAVEPQMTKHQLLEMMMFFAESAAGGPGGGGGGFTGGRSDCLVRCFNTYIGCIKHGYALPQLCDRNFGLCNTRCFTYGG